MRQHILSKPCRFSRAADIPPNHMSQIHDRKGHLRS
jgi:hypothetical protein